MREARELESLPLSSDDTLDVLTDKIHISVLPSDPHVVVSNEINLDSVTEALNALTIEVTNQQEQLRSIAEPNIADWAIVISTSISLCIALIALFISNKESKDRIAEAERIEKLNHQKALADKQAEELAIERQKLSVKPYVILQTDHCIGDGEFKAFLINKGLGPAMFKSFSMYIDKKRIVSDSPLHKAIDTLLAQDHDYDVKAVFGIEAMAISPSESIMLYSIKLRNLDEDFANCYAVHEKLISLGFGVEYESIYGERTKEGFASL